MKTSVHKPSDAHRQFRDDLIEVLRKHGEQLSAQEMLALASHLVGQLIAMQDQRTMTRDMAMEIVVRNIEQGNQEVAAGLSTTKGTS